MNQRIDQLWAQALDAAVPETYTQLSHSQVLKIKQVFADMIVQECKENFAKVWYEQGMDIRGADLDKFLTRLEEHFGVES
jgi:uncharacterized protein (DUF2267 family)